MVLWPRTWQESAPISLSLTSRLRYHLSTCWKQPQGVPPTLPRAWHHKHRHRLTSSLENVGHSLSQLPQLEKCQGAKPSWPELAFTELQGQALPLLIVSIAAILMTKKKIIFSWERCVWSVRNEPQAALLHLHVSLRTLPGHSRLSCGTASLQQCGNAACAQLPKCICSAGNPHPRRHTPSQCPELGSEDLTSLFFIK